MSFFFLSKIQRKRTEFTIEQINEISIKASFVNIISCAKAIISNIDIQAKIQNWIFR